MLCVGAYEITGETRGVPRQHQREPIPRCQPCGPAFHAHRSAVTVSLGRRSREFLVNERRLPQYYARATHYRVTWLTVEPRGGLIAYANEGAVRAGLVGNNPLALTEFASAS
jgi:hypothetical protein